MNISSRAGGILALSFLSLMNLHAASDTWHGLPAEILSSDSLRVVILPEQGGSMASLYSVPKKQEWLWALPDKKQSWGQGMPAAYDLSGGIEDSFPTLGAVTSPDPAASIPFFGSVWNKPWQVTHRTDRALSCTYYSTEPAYTLEKSWSLEGDQLKIHYRWTNTGPKPLEAIWVAHALFQMDEDTRIELPEGTPLRIHSWIKDGHEQFGGNVKWPLFTEETPPRDLSKVSTNTFGRSDKLYITELKDTTVDLRHKDGSQLSLTFGKGVESVGLWINQKAFPFTGDRYSIIGIEPATSAYEALDEARAHDKSMMLASGESRTWEYSIRVH